MKHSKDVGIVEDNESLTCILIVLTDNEVTEHFAFAFGDVYLYKL